MGFWRCRAGFIQIHVKPHQILHPLALVSLAIVAAEAIQVNLRHPVNRLPLAAFFVAAVWGFLLWKVWKRPRQWGLGMGIFLLLLIPFQTFLFRLAVAESHLDVKGISWGAFLLFDEFPLLIAGVSCLLLRVYYPRLAE